eukprot:scaffold76250_cov27-Tisochrysis_lutea.AAC.4
MGLAGVVAAGFTPSLAPAAAGYGGGYGSLPRATGAGQADGGSAPRLSFPPTGPQHPTFHRLHIGPPPPPPNTKGEPPRPRRHALCSAAYVSHCARRLRHAPSK